MSIAQGATPGVALLSVMVTLVLYLWRINAATNRRVDGITATQIKGISDERDRALRERDDARVEAQDAEEEADRWRAKAQELAVDLARAQIHLDVLKAAVEPGTESSGAADP